jgi:Asparagine synthase
MNVTIDNPALFLTYRRFFPTMSRGYDSIDSENEIVEYIKSRLQDLPVSSGILLSGGIDSAILARFMPAGSVAYTIEYEEAQNRSEFQAAARFLARDVRHQRVFVGRRKFFKAAEELVSRKRMPLVPHEPAVAVACQQALRDGVTHLVGGFGADSGFGGFPNYYRNCRWDDFARNILPKFWDPSAVLKQCGDVAWVARQYVAGGLVDVQSFLKEVGAEGNAVATAVQALGLTPVFPYGDMRYNRRFDVERIVSGDDKYLLKEIFGRLYPNLSPAQKFPLHVPYNQWMMGYQPSRKEFKENLKLQPDQGKRNALVYSLERYFIHQENGWPSPGSSSCFSFSNRVARSTYAVTKAIKRGMAKVSVFGPADH